MNRIIPTLGRTVLYVLNETDAEQINRRRTNSTSIQQAMAVGQWPAGVQAHIGNHVKAGQTFPATVVAVWGNTPAAAVNLQVHLDGSDTFWATSRVHSEEGRYGTYIWPGQA